MGLVLAQSTCANEVVKKAWERELGTPVFASPVLADVNNDGAPEIAVSSLDGSVYLMDGRGRTLEGWPRKVALFQRVSPSVADIDGDGEVEVVVGDDSGQLHVWNAVGEYVSGFPVQLEGTIKSVARIQDVQGDGRMEILVHAGSSKLYLLDSEGKNVSGWPVELGGEADQFGSWTIASTPNWVDLDSDGTLEVVVGTTRNDVQAFRVDGSPVDGWAAKTEDWVYPSVVAADLEGDGLTELIAGAGDGKLYVWDNQGKVREGFPIDLGSPVVSTAAVANLEGGDCLEIVVADLNGSVHCLDASGNYLSGWPKQAGAGCVASPLVIDVDGDGSVDVLVPSRDNTIHAWRSDGGEIAVSELAAKDWIESTPVAGDLDGDGLVELVYASHDGFVYCVDLSTQASSEALAWAGFLGESKFEVAVSPGDTDRDGLPDTYEMIAFGSLDEAGEQDFDADGCSNYEEWVAGTDPVRGDDSLQVAMVHRRSGDGVAFGLRWNGRTDRAYKIFATDAIDGSAVEWYPVAGDESIRRDSDGDFVWFADSALATKQCFYRVQVERL